MTWLFHDTDPWSPAAEALPSKSQSLLHLHMAFTMAQSPGLHFLQMCVSAWSILGVTAKITVEK